MQIPELVRTHTHSLNDNPNVFCLSIKERDHGTSRFSNDIGNFGKKQTAAPSRRLQLSLVVRQVFRRSFALFLIPQNATTILIPWRAMTPSSCQDPGVVCQLCTGGGSRSGNCSFYCVSYTRQHEQLEKSQRFVCSKSSSLCRLHRRRLRFTLWRRICSG